MVVAGRLHLHHQRNGANFADFFSGFSSAGAGAGGFDCRLVGEQTVQLQAVTDYVRKRINLTKTFKNFPQATYRVPSSW